MGNKRRSKGKYARSSQLAGAEKPGTRGMAGGEDSLGRGGATIASSVFRDLPAEYMERLGTTGPVASILTGPLASAFNRKEQLSTLAQIRAMFKEKQEPTTVDPVELSASVEYLTAALLAPAPSALVPSISSTITVLIAQGNTYDDHFRKVATKCIQRNALTKAPLAQRLQEIGDACLVLYTAIDLDLCVDVLVSSFGVLEILQCLVQFARALNTKYVTENSSASNQGVEIMEVSNVAGRLLSTLQTYITIPSVVNHFMALTDSDQTLSVLTEMLKIAQHWLEVPSHPKDLCTKCAIVLIVGTLRVLRLPAGDLATSKKASDTDRSMQTTTESESDSKLLAVMGEWIDVASCAFDSPNRDTPPSETLTKKEFDTLPSYDWLAAATPLVMLSLCRAVLCHTSIVVLFGNSNGNQTPLIERLFRWVQLGCRSSSATTRVYGLQTLEVWASTLSQAHRRSLITECDWSTFVEDIVSIQCMSIILDNWDHSMRSVTRLLGPVMEKVLTLLVELYSTFSKANTNWPSRLLHRILGPTQGASSHLEPCGTSMDPNTKSEMYGKLQIASKGSCVALGSILPILGYRQIMEQVPDLVDQLVAAVEYTTVATAAVGVLTSLLSLANDEDPDNVVGLMMNPLAQHLTSNSSLHRKRVVEYVLPITLPVYPQLVGSLLSAIALTRNHHSTDENSQSAVKELSLNDRCLLAKLAVLGVVRKHGHHVRFFPSNQEGYPEYSTAVVPTNDEPGDGDKRNANNDDISADKEAAGSSKRRRKALRQANKMKFQVSAGDVERACLSSEADLQLCGLQLLLEAQTKGVLPSQTEIDILRNVLPVAIKAPTNEMRNNVTFQMRKLIERFVVALPANRKKVQALQRFSEATPEQQNEIAKLKNEESVSLEFLHWLQRLALSSLYPTAPFERAGTALELLLSLVSVFSKEISKIAKIWRLGREVAMLESTKDAANAKIYGREIFTLENKQNSDESFARSVFNGIIPNTFALAPLFTESSTIALLNMMISSYDRARNVAGNVLRQLPSPLPGFTTRESLQRVVTWSLKLMGSAKIRESDAGALILSLIRDKYATELGWAIDLPSSTTSSWESIIARKKSEDDIEQHGRDAVVQLVRQQVARSRDLAMMYHASQLALSCERSDGAYCVGALVVNNEAQILATGYSRESWGNTHAEEVALKKLGLKALKPESDSDVVVDTEGDSTTDNAHGAASGCTMYTSMEPCSKRLSGNRTCTSRVLASKISRVVVGVLEPNKFVQNCEGVKLLRDNGVQVDVIQDPDVEYACKVPNGFLFPEEGTDPLDSKKQIIVLRKMHALQLGSRGMSIPSDLADLHFLWQLVGVFEARLRYLYVADGVDLASGVANTAVKNTLGVGSADEPSTLANSSAPLVVGGSDSQEAMFVNGSLLALRYTWEQVNFVRYLGHPHASGLTNVGHWRKLLESMLSRVFSGLNLAMKVVGEVADPPTESGNASDNDTASSCTPTPTTLESQGANGTSRAVELEENSSQSEGEQLRNEDPGEYLVKTLTSGAQDAPKGLKVDCRGHLIVESEQVADGQSEQLIVVGAWLLVKEGSNLLGALTRTTPLSMQLCSEESSKEWVMSIKQVKHIGEWFLNTLLSLKHQGAISYAAVAFQVVCEEVLAHAGVQLDHVTQRSSSQTEDELLCRLPSRWLDMLLVRLAKKEQAFILRRSAGFAAAFLSIARSEPRNCPATLLTTLMEKLMFLVTGGIAMGTSDENSTDNITTTHWRVVVHALNVVKLVFQDATLASDLHQFLAHALQLSIHGFKSPVWAVRNSSMMVFASILNRIVGSRRKNLQGITTQFDGVTAAQFFSSHPSLYEFLLGELREAVSQGSKGSREMHPSLYPILLLLSRLSPGSVRKKRYQSESNKDTEQQMPLEPFVEQVMLCSKQIHFAARQMASLALASAVPSSMNTETVLKLGKQLVEAVLSTPMLFNNVHGLLMMLTQQIVNAASIQRDANSQHGKVQVSPISMTELQRVAIVCSKLTCDKIKSASIRVSAVQLLWELFNYTKEVVVGNESDAVSDARNLSSQVAMYVRQSAKDYFSVGAAGREVCNSWTEAGGDLVTSNVFGDRLSNCTAAICVDTLDHPDSWPVMQLILRSRDAKCRLPTLRQLCLALKSGKLESSSIFLTKSTAELVSLTLEECMNEKLDYVVELCMRLRYIRLVLKASDAPGYVAQEVGLDTPGLHSALERVFEITSCPKLQGAILRLLAATEVALASSENPLSEHLFTRVVLLIERLAVYSTVAQLRVATAKAMGESGLLNDVTVTSKSASWSLVRSPDDRATLWVAAAKLIQDEDPEVRERVRHCVCQAVLESQGSSSVPFKVLEEVFNKAGLDVAQGGLEVASTEVWFDYIADGLGFNAFVFTPDSDVEMTGAEFGVKNALATNREGTVLAENIIPSQVISVLLDQGSDLGLFSTPVFETEPDNLFVEPSEIAKLCAFQGSGSASGNGMMFANSSDGSKSSLSIAKRVSQEFSKTVKLIFDSQESVSWLGGITYHPQAYLVVMQLLYSVLVVVPHHKEVLEEAEFQESVKQLKQMVENTLAIESPTAWCTWLPSLQGLATEVVSKCWR